MSDNTTYQWPDPLELDLNSELSAARRSVPEPQSNVGGWERMASLAAGSGLLAFGLARRTLPGVAMAALGAALVQRGWSGRCRVYGALGLSTRPPTGEQADTVVREGIMVHHQSTVDRPAAELYRLWRDFESLPKIMGHLTSVEDAGNGRSHWILGGPLGQRVEWDAEIIADREGEVISWRSLPDAEVDSAGSVRFTEAPGKRGTEVRIQFSYQPPAGRAGAVAAWLFGDSAQQMVEADLQRFKAFAECGTIPAATVER
jgi:uncharacterized membrane protein